jgi:hypothetical protein
MTSTRAERAFAAVQQELDNERAAVLGRTGRGLDAALATCSALVRLLDTPIDDDDDARAALLVEYRAARATSEAWRWRLHVQREVLGLTDHRWVDRIYPPPAMR